MPSVVRQVIFLHEAGHAGGRRHHIHESPWKAVSLCALLSCCCCDKSPNSKPNGLNTTETYSLIVLEARCLTESSELKSRWSQAWFPLENYSFPPPDPGGSWCSLACGHITLIASCVVTGTSLFLYPSCKDPCDYY